MRRILMMSMVTLLFLLTQCKPDPIDNSTDNNNVDNCDDRKVTISCELPINGKTRSDFNSLFDGEVFSGKINWSSGEERIYLALPKLQDINQYQSHHAQFVRLVATDIHENASVATFYGEIDEHYLEYALENDVEYDLWYFGNSMVGEHPSPVVRFDKDEDGHYTSVFGFLSEQSGDINELGRYHVARTTVKVEEKDGALKLKQQSRLQTQIAIALLDLEGVEDIVGSAIFNAYQLIYNDATNKYDFEIIDDEPHQTIDVAGRSGISYIALLPNQAENVMISSRKGRYEFKNAIVENNVYYTVTATDNTPMPLVWKTNATELPSVITTDVTDLEFTAATCGGEILDDGGGIVLKGICWGEEHNPTIEDNNHTLPIRSTGEFSCRITSGLKPNTTYHYRAYAMNPYGIAYGGCKTFTTKDAEMQSVDVVVDGKKIIVNMIAVEGGTFTMGDGAADAPSHSVTLSDYYIGETEVTQELWDAVMGAENDNSQFYGEQKPVDNVSWLDAKEFIEKLNQLTGKKFRLPTEAEWEFAARGGTKSHGYKYSGSDNCDEVASYRGTTGYTETHAVKSYKANEIGTYDMSGNVWEWCEDTYDKMYYTVSPYPEPIVNPQGPAIGNNKVYRGGAWCDYASSCTVAKRGNNDRKKRTHYTGMRLALDI